LGCCCRLGEADVQDEVSEPEIQDCAAGPVHDVRQQDDGEDDDHQPEEEHNDSGDGVPGCGSRSSHGRQLPGAARLIRKREPSVLRLKSPMTWAWRALRRRPWCRRSARMRSIWAAGRHHSGLGSQRNRLIATKPPATPQIARTSSWRPANPRSRASGFSSAWLNGRTGKTPARSLRNREVIWK